MKAPRRSEYDSEEDYKEACEEYDYWVDSQYEINRIIEEERK